MRTCQLIASVMSNARSMSTDQSCYESSHNMHVLVLTSAAVCRCSSRAWQRGQEGTMRPSVCVTWEGRLPINSVMSDSFQHSCTPPHDATIFSFRLCCCCCCCCVQQPNGIKTPSVLSCKGRSSVATRLGDSSVCWPQACPFAQTKS